jgi:hypothetical protein
MLPSPTHNSWCAKPAMPCRLLCRVGYRAARGTVPWDTCALQLLSGRTRVLFAHCWGWVGGRTLPGPLQNMHTPEIDEGIDKIVGMLTLLKKITTSWQVCVAGCARVHVRGLCECAWSV